jgi:two-component system, chemotaxis family, chemotaxis protein CheY
MAKFDYIIARFCRSLPLQVQALSDRLALLAPSETEPPMALAQCLEDAHRLAGGANCAGFATLGAAFDALEMVLMRLASCAPEKTAMRDVIKKEIRNALRRVLEAAATLTPEQSSLWGAGGAETGGVALAGLAALVVEDDDATRRLLHAILRAEGAANIVLAANGLEALDMLGVNNPAFAICSWRMAPISGMEFLKFVRSGRTAAKPDLPVLMITSYAHDAHEQAAREAGADGYIVKPFAQESLIASVKAALTRRASCPPGAPAERKNIA